MDTNTKPQRKPKPYKYAEANTLGRTVGIEVTFLPGCVEYTDVAPPKYGTNSVLEHLNAGYMKIFTSRISTMPAILKLTNRVGTDPDVVEISTAPINSRGKLNRVLTTYYDIAGALGMVTSTDWHGGGGAHIHVGRKKDEHADMDKAMGLLAAHHPYMTWAFMNPGDKNKNAAIHSDIIARSIANTLGGAVYDLERVRQVLDNERNIYWGYMRTEGPAHRWTIRSLERMEDTQRCVTGQLARMLKHKRVSPSNVYPRICNVFQKGSAIARRDIGKYGTWEFRLFRAPDDMEGHTRQLNFALAYVEHCERLVSSGMVPDACMDTLAQAHHANPYPVAVAKFKELLTTLGLKHRDYAADIRNMKRYYEINKLDLTSTTAPTTPLSATIIRMPVVRLPRRLARRKHKRRAFPA